MSNFEVEDRKILVSEERRAKRFHPSSFYGSIFNIIQLVLQIGQSRRNRKWDPI
jgi:hypothetical protein